MPLVFDSVPLWIVILGSVALFLVAIESGFRLGRYRKRMPQAEDEAPSSSMVAATLGLLGFMLAFTFGMAATRYDTRKQLVMDEANAIGTTYLRAGMLPEPLSAESRELLRTYVDTRLMGASDQAELVRSLDESTIREAVVASERIHTELWSRIQASMKENPGSLPSSLYTESLNDVIDLHSVRVTNAFQYRIPSTIWVALMTLSLLAMAALGFHGGLSSRRRSAGTLLVTFAFVLVILLIVDLDRAREGFLLIDQGPLFDLKRSMEAGPR